MNANSETVAVSAGVDRITIRRPDDWHLHLRDGAMLVAVLPYTVRQFARAIIMPNLVPPVVTTADALAYRRRILAALPEGSDFEPLMTAYLTDHTDPDDLERGKREGVLTAVKLYPAHATTNSAHGVGDIRSVRPVLERMEKIGLPLLIHGEVTDTAVDTFDREAVFIERVLAPLAREMPGLRIVFEHVTTKEAVEFVQGDRPGIGATITPQHLMYNRNALFVGGIRPHFYCLPILKREVHRQALRRAATSGDPRFFLGTDSAPHMAHLKENACGCAGCFSAATALEMYAGVFDEAGALDRLEAFASLNGPAFYGLPVNQGSVTLAREGTEVPGPVAVGPDSVLPFDSGSRLPWRVL